MTPTKELAANCGQRTCLLCPNNKSWYLIGVTNIGTARVGGLTGGMPSTSRVVVVGVRGLGYGVEREGSNSFTANILVFLSLLQPLLDSARSKSR